MTKNPLIISSSRADRWLLSPVAERLGSGCEFLGFDKKCRVDRDNRPMTPDDAPIYTYIGWRYDIEKVIILGDRVETVGIAYEAIKAGKIVYHLHGGEVTSGSRDEIYRHAITKLSHVHLTAHQDFADRVIKMGENPANVFVVGSLGVWRAKQLSGKIINGPMKRITVILHPNTIEPEKTESEVLILLEALNSFRGDFRIEFYAPNHDSGRDITERKIKAFCELNSGCSYFDEVAGDEFLLRLKHSACIVGNSSCGIIEAPSLRTPTVNIGNRQDGRPMTSSMINVSFSKEQIVSGIRCAINNPSVSINPYDNTDEDTVEMICGIIQNHPVEFKKRFYD